MNALDWLLDSDPSVRWQALQDLAGAPADVVATERARVVTEGWGARLLALRSDDGQWAGGAYFPAQGGGSAVSPPGGAAAPDSQGDSGGHEWAADAVQPWTATTYSLLQLRDFGVDPGSEQLRRTVALVRDNCRWEEGGQPYFAGEVEPCINGMALGLGAYFGEDVNGVVARLVNEQLDDGGWNCWAEFGAVVSSAATTINVLEGLLAHEQSTGGSTESIEARRRGGEYLLERRLPPARSLTRRGWNSHFRHAGTTTSSVPWSISGPPVVRPTRARPRQSRCFGPRGSPMVRGCWKTRIPGRSTSSLRRVTGGPAAGTPCERCGSCGGTRTELTRSPLRAHDRRHSPIGLHCDCPSGR